MRVRSIRALLYHNCKANSPKPNIVIISCIHKYLSTWHNTFQGDQGNDLFD